MARKRGYSLVFNGHELEVYDSRGGLIAHFPTTSGKPGTSAYDQYVENEGPIPEGLYYIDPGKFIERNLWTTIRHRLFADWGDYIVNLEPDPDTYVGTRDGFYLHGGKDPGSAGCIDVGENDVKLYHLLKDHNGRVPVYVEYPETVAPWEELPQNIALDAYNDSYDAHNDLQDGEYYQDGNYQDAYGDNHNAHDHLQGGEYYQDGNYQDAYGNSYNVHDGLQDGEDPGIVAPWEEFPQSIALDAYGDSHNAHDGLQDREPGIVASWEKLPMSIVQDAYDGNYDAHHGLQGGEYYQDSSHHDAYGDSHDAHHGSYDGDADFF